MMNENSYEKPNLVYNENRKCNFQLGCPPLQARRALSGG